MDGGQVIREEYRSVMTKILESIDAMGGNVPVRHDKYLAKATVLKAKDKDVKIEIAQAGIQNLLLHAKIEVKHWLNRSTTDYLAGIEEEHKSDEFIKISEKAEPKTIDFYLTDKTILTLYDFGRATMMAKVKLPEEQIELAKNALKTAKIIGYKDSGCVADIVGEDGTRINYGMVLGMAGYPGNPVKVEKKSLMRKIKEKAGF